MGLSDGLRTHMDAVAAMASHRLARVGDGEMGAAAAGGGEKGDAIAIADFGDSESLWGMDCTCCASLLASRGNIRTRLSGCTSAAASAAMTAMITELVILSMSVGDAPAKVCGLVIFFQYQAR